MSFPRESRVGNLLNEDLMIKSFILYRFEHSHNSHCVQLYILTDFVEMPSDSFFETVVRILSSNGDYYDDIFEIRCSNVFEAYNHHKKVHKKVLRGFFDNEIRELEKRYKS